MLRRGVLAAALAGPACTDRPVVEQCFEVVWRVELGASSGRVADATLGADGSLLLLMDDDDSVILELSAEGELREGPHFPEAGATVSDRHPVALAIDQDGRRWATMVEWSRAVGVWSVFVDDGGPELQAQSIVAPDDAWVWSVGSLAVHGASLFVGGTVRAPEQDAFEGEAFVGRLSGLPPTLQPLAMPPGMQAASVLVPSDDRRLYVLAGPASIDYRDVDLFAVDPQTARIAWQHPVGSTGDPWKPYVLGAAPAGDGVVVASFDDEALVLERFAAEGESDWRLVYPLATRGYAADVASAPEHIVAVVEDRLPVPPDRRLPTPQVVIAEHDGALRCSGELALPESSVQLVLDPARDRAFVVSDVDGSDPATIVALAL